MELNRLNIAVCVSKILICMCFHVLDQHVVVDRGLSCLGRKQAEHASKPTEVREPYTEPYFITWDPLRYLK